SRRAARPGGARPRGGGPERQPRGGASAWKAESELFPPLDAAAQAALARLPEALARVRPLSAAHRRSLPEDIAKLSRALTAERAELRRPYWSRPAFVSAYLYYFLPWNLVRLARLFRGLPLPTPATAEGPALLLDAGSGPLTVPLALWLARPEWRSLPIQVLALDSARQPLELGRALFVAMGEALGEAVWPVRLAKGPLESLAAHAQPLLEAGGRPWLVTAANVLNEARPPRGGRGGPTLDDEEDDGADVPLPGLTESRLDRLLSAWSPLLAPAPDAGNGVPRQGGSPALLFVEPGTRLGGNTLMRLRALAVEGGLHAVAPCVADTRCPLKRGAWCHFTFSPAGAPRWLAELSTAAGLAKRSLSLSPLLLRAAPEVETDAARAGEEPAAPRARVLSSPFDVPGVNGLARYACAPCGLALLEDAGTLAPGSLVDLGEAAKPRPGGKQARRDARSGARIFAAPQERAQRVFKKKS
ncbi:small ribosomal subunit Rsm22 family protein, partial [Desulfovibrio sp.]|uniref:small ribosomal subunit Rsm22 family protein n=1 Tax=Desulfovibrio sp. TaxID=885 RepID=UPI0023BFDC2A